MRVFTAFGPVDRTPVSFANSGRSGFLGAFGSRAGASRTAQLDSMATMSTVYAIVTKLASGTASVDWHLYRTAASGLDEDRVEVTKHAALSVLNKPNPFMTRQEFFEVVEQHIDLVGESEWLCSTDPRMPGVPLELWPIRPDRIKPVAHPTEFLTGWIYRDPDGQDIPLDRDEVIQVRSPNPTDPYRGLGPIGTVMSDIEGDAYAAEFNRNFFLNSAEPGGIITVDHNLTDTEFRDMRDRWNEQFKGVSRAHRVGILEQGTYQPNSTTQRDMQFADLRGVSKESVREAFGFPKPMLGAVDNVNLANAVAGEYMFTSWCIVPRLDRLKGALNNDFLPKFGATAEGLEFDYDNPVPEDEVAETGIMTSKVQMAVSLKAAGFDPAAVLSMLGLPDLPLAQGQVFQ